MQSAARRISFGFLCLTPFLLLPIAGIRALRLPGIYQVVGALLFAAVVIAAWVLGARALRASSAVTQRLALAGTLLLAPWAVISLLWVGLGPPWGATPPENQMRYTVLLFGAVAITTAFVVLRESLSEAGERLHSAYGLALTLLAGTSYVLWISFELGVWVGKTKGAVPEAVIAIENNLDTLLFVCCVLTYGATAAFAASLGRIQWMGRGAARTYVILNVVAFTLIALRGFSFPDPNAGEPWYTRPAFIAGIPAVPWIMPFLIGVVLLRQAGEASDV